MRLRTSLLALAGWARRRGAALRIVGRIMNGYTFTERVRAVLAMAREESQRLHHAFVGTEHLLLALAREGQGVGATALRNLGVDLAEVRQQVDDVLTVGTAGPDELHELPYTSRAKKSIELAISEARELGHSYMGTEHLLLGMLREEQNIGAQVLGSLGVELPAVRAEVLRLLGIDATPAGADTTAAPAAAIPAVTYAARDEPPDHWLVAHAFSFSPWTEVAVNVAAEAARRLHHHAIEPEHLLHGLLHVWHESAPPAGLRLTAGVDELRERLSTQLAPASEARVPGAAVHFSVRGTRALAQAILASCDDEARQVSPDHLLAGLLHEGAGDAVAFLREAGVEGT
jgi:ATP-dependent Clp protease ATP-binding subunit ClpA